MRKKKKRSRTIRALKRAVFTIEAAYIVPICVTVIAVLMGYNYYMHERCRNLAVACEAGVYAASKSADNKLTVEKLQDKLDKGKETEPLSVSWNNYSTKISSTKINITYSESVLPEVFGDLYKDSGKVSIEIMQPVKFKRLEWVAENVY